MQSSEAIAKLIADLQGPDESTRSLAAFALVLLGGPAVNPLTHLLDNPNSEVRMRAAWALGVIGAPAIPAMLELAEGNDTRLRTEAIRVLGVIGEARTLNHLLNALTDPNDEVAARAARAIGRIGDPRAYHPLITALRHPSPDVRYEACRALNDLRLPDAAPLLRELSRTDEGKTSWGAAVSEVAQRAAEEVSRAERNSLDEEFSRISKLLQKHARLDTEKK